MSFIEFLKKNKHDGSDIDADKTFVRSIAISFFAVTICIVMLAASSFAWFNTSIESKNVIESSVYALEITTLSDEVGATTTTLSATGLGEFSFVAEAGVTYVITAKTTDNTTARTGYIKLTTNHMADGEGLYSTQIDNGAGALSFSLRFSDATEVHIFQHWGTSIRSERDIHDGYNFVDLILQEENN